MGDNPLDRLRDLEAELASLKRQRVWVEDGGRVLCYLADAEYPVGTMMWMQPSGIATKRDDDIPWGFAPLGHSVAPPPLPLQPTDEQLDDIEAAVASSGARGDSQSEDKRLNARAAWTAIAPMVLEAVEQACEQVRSKVEPASLDIPLLEFTQKDHEAAGVLKCIAAIRAMKGTGAVDPEVFTCPICGAQSWNPNDAENRYCGRCHRFVDETPPK